MHLLHNQPEEVLFGHFVTTLNDAFEREYSLADEGYDSGSKTSNLPTTLRRTSRIHHVSSNEHISLTLLLHAPQLPASQTASLFTTIYHLAVLMTKEFLQFRTAPHYHWTIWVCPSQHPSTPIPWVMILKKKEISKQLHWMMSIDLQNQCLIYVCAWMNIHSHILGVTTDVFMAQIPLQYHTLTCWILLTFLTTKMWWPYPVMRTSLL